MIDQYTIDNETYQIEPTGCKVGIVRLKVGAYWAFRNAQRHGEDADLTMFRLIRERNHFKKWSYILAVATALAVILAATP